MRTQQLPDNNTENNPDRNEIPSNIISLIHLTDLVVRKQALVKSI